MTVSILDLFKGSKWKILYFLVLMLGGFWISSMWPIFLIIWLGISLFWSYSRLVESLSEFEKKIYNLSLYIYPLIGTFIKVYIYFDFIPDTYFWVNRFEHALWSAALVVLLLPAWKSFKFANSNNKQSEFALFFVILGVSCLFGNMVEFVEYVLRFIGGYQYKYAVYYPDTIFDMMSNVVGGILGFILMIFNRQKLDGNTKTNT